MLDRRSVLKESIEKLVRLVAQSSNFQEEVQKYTQEDAEPRIHKVVAGDVRGELDDLPRPWALIEIGDRNKSRNAGGSGNTFKGDGWLVLTLAGEMLDPLDPDNSLVAFADWAYAVLEDLCEKAGVDDNLNIAECEQEQKPIFSPPQDGMTVPWCWCSWRIQWTRF